MEKQHIGTFRDPIGYRISVPGSSRKPAAPPAESITWSEATWPVVQITCRDGRDERFIWLLRQFEGLFARGQRYVLLVDTTALSTIPSAATRHVIAKWQNAHNEETKTWCAGSAILISSRLVRGAITAINWVNEPVIKQCYPSTRREALDWCIRTVDEAGLTIDATARAALQSRDG